MGISGGDMFPLPPPLPYASGRNAFAFDPYIACLCAAVAVVIQRVGLSEVTVAVDGSVYRFHPHFKQLMSSKLSQLLPAHLQVYILTHCRDILKH